MGSGNGTSTLLAAPQIDFRQDTLKNSHKLKTNDLQQLPHTMQSGGGGGGSTCFFVIWDVVFIDVHGEAQWATIRETAGSETNAEKQLDQHKVNRLYPCIYERTRFLCRQ